MTSVIIEFDKLKPPKFWINIQNYIENKHPDNYDMYKMLLTAELRRYDGLLNPLFASNYNMNTLYFNNKRGYDAFVTKWSKHKR